jgi:hypothetical protein
VVNFLCLFFLIQKSVHGASSNISPFVNVNVAQPCCPFCSLRHANDGRS